jgi:ribonuclease BN (tRNA processing enzyme)
MEITFLGVGEAFDEYLPNTSMLVRTDHDGEPVALLLDCGYSVPPRFWQLGLNPDALNTIWISHFHADHAFGLPALLVRFWEEDRKEDLHFLGQRGVEHFVRSCLDLAYPTLYPRLGYSLRFIEVEPGEPLTVLGLSWSTAVNDHPQRDLALRLDAKGKSLFYSGDGSSTAETRALAQHAGLIIHEAFQISKKTPGHGTVAGCLEMAHTSQARRLALVHIQRQVRRERLGEIRRLAARAAEVEVIIPEPGDRITV